MTQRIRVLRELGEELERAVNPAPAQRPEDRPARAAPEVGSVSSRLTQSVGTAPGRASLGAVATVLAAVVAIGIAVGAFVLLGPATRGPKRATGIAEMSNVDGVHFLSRSVGWIATYDNSRLLMTTDGGGKWVDVSPPVLRRKGSSLAGGLPGAFFASASDFWIAVWTRVPGQHYFGRTEVLHTSDGGRSWAPAGTFARFDVNAWLYFADGLHGWLVVGNGAAANEEPVSVYATSTGGAHWSQVARSASPSTPGTPGAPSPGCDKSGLGYSPRGAATPASLWITGSCDVGLALQRSSDGGRVWRPVAPAPIHRRLSNGGNTFAPIFFTPSVGVLKAQRGTRTALRDVIYTTSDGGSRWTAHQPPTPTDGQIDIVSATTWVIAGNHALYVTHDAGLDWTQMVTSIALDGARLRAIDFVNRTDGWIVTSHGKLQTTTDGGHTWTPARRATSAASARCAPPRGPGDHQIHTRDVRARNIDCRRAQRVIIGCARFSYGHRGTCRVVGDRWFCTSRRPLRGIMSPESCVGGRSAVSWVWLD